MDWTQIVLAAIALLGTGGGVGAGILKGWQMWLDRKPSSPTKTDNEYLRDYYRDLAEIVRKENEERVDRARKDNEERIALLKKDYEASLVRVTEQYLQLKTEYANYVTEMKTQSSKANKP